MVTAYLSIYGPKGEFNENVSYAGSTRLPLVHALYRAACGAVYSTDALR